MYRRDGLLRQPLRGALIILVSLEIAGCGGALGPGSAVRIAFDLLQGPQQWTPGVSDFTAAVQAGIGFVADYRLLAAPLNTSGSALFISGHNVSDDLFMYYKHRIGGLTANGRYTTTFSVKIATNVPRGCKGIGGAPGESVYVKVGASTDEPLTIVDSAGRATLNLDKGNQATSGASATVIGNVAGSFDCSNGSNAAWELKTLSGGGISVQADSAGSAWVIVGTDSGLEGTTSIYYSK
jgi:hypothetical protein